MSSLQALIGFLKKLAIIILMFAVAIPFRYGSIDPQYLTLRLLHSALSLKHCILSDPTRPTLSADYRAFENILRMTRRQHDPSDDPFLVTANLRSTFKMGSIIPKPSQCQVNREIFKHDGHLVDAYWIDNHQRKFQKNSDKLLLYLHGGAYIVGDVHSEWLDASLFKDFTSCCFEQVTVESNVISQNFSIYPFFILNMVLILNIHYRQLLIIQ